MLLAIDMGNNNVKFGVFENGSLINLWRLRTDPGRTADEYVALLQPLFAQAGLRFEHITGVAVASVVPSATPDLLRLARQAFAADPLQISGNTDLGLQIAYEPPGDVGADRLADAVAAVHRWGAPCIVIDFGTATTFNAIAPPVPNKAGASDERPIYLGGAICLGIGLSLDALYSKAAKLSRVEIAKPPHAIGANTAHALQSGILYGYLSQVEGFVARFRAEMSVADCPVIATGGHAGTLIAQESPVITAIEPNLTLEGLHLVYARQQP